MFESLPGFREFYPDACFRRNHIFTIWREVTRCFGFEEYDGPILEALELYTRKSGDEIVDQLFAFTDKGGREVAMRPEMTPTLARMIGSRAHSLRRPIKWFTIAENFRYERPSRGRLRSHYQLNADIYGESGIGAEVELLSLLAGLFQAFDVGPDDVKIRLSDRDIWFYYLKYLGIEESRCLPLLTVIDKMGRSGEEESKRGLEVIAPGQADFLWERIGRMASLRSVPEMRDFFQEKNGGGNAQIEARLEQWNALHDALELQGIDDFIQVDLGIVRGLAYYTGFVFEAFETSSQGRALAGGGRYDQLVEKLGGPAMPAVGFGFGDVMIELVLQRLEKMPPYQPALDVYFVFSRGEMESRLVMTRVHRLRRAGLRVDYSLKSIGFGKQFREASQKGARRVVICGVEEAEKGIFKVKTMSTGEEVEVPACDLEKFFKEHV